MTGAAFLCSRSADYGQDDEAREATTRRSDKLNSDFSAKTANIYRGVRFSSL
jgi:hypothetical protein